MIRSIFFIFVLQLRNSKKYFFLNFLNIHKNSFENSLEFLGIFGNSQEFLEILRNSLEILRNSLEFLSILLEFLSILLKFIRIDRNSLRILGNSQEFIRNLQELFGNSLGILRNSLRIYFISGSPYSLPLLQVSDFLGAMKVASCMIAL